MAYINEVEYPSYYQPYIELVSLQKLTDCLSVTINDLLKCCERLSKQQALYRYKAGKWSVKEIIQHLIDVERIFCYRALSISRGDTSFKSFDENKYVVKCNADYRPLNDLLAEATALRKSTILLFNSFGANMLHQTGSVENNQITVNALGYIIAGHQLHHTKIIKERYIHNLSKI